MSVQDTALNPVILESAVKEFMQNGFIKTSIRDIAKNANVTTGAIYKRYKGKEELFEAAVKPALDVLYKVKNIMIAKNEERKKTNNMSKMFSESIIFLKFLLRELYSEYEAMRILLCKAEGSKYANYVRDFAEENVKLTYDFMQQLTELGISKVNLSYKEYHIILTSYWSSIFEIIVHDFTLEEALMFCEKIDGFFNWKRVLEF